MDLAAEVGGEPTDDEQRDDAETTAAHHVYTAYPSTLAQVVEAMDWQGYPALRQDGVRVCEPSAVAWLGGGLWLHHTLHVTEQDGARDVLTLIVPCTCGHGYVDIHLETEDELLEILAELRPTHGRSRTPTTRSTAAASTPSRGWAPPCGSGPGTAEASANGRPPRGRSSPRHETGALSSMPAQHLRAAGDHTARGAPPTP